MEGEARGLCRAQKPTPGLVHSGHGPVVQSGDRRGRELAPGTPPVMDKLQFSTQLSHRKATNTLLTVKKKKNSDAPLVTGGRDSKTLSEVIAPKCRNTSQATAEDLICDGRGGGALVQNQTSVLLCPSMPDRRSEAGSWKKLPTASLSALTPV